MDSDLGLDHAKAELPIFPLPRTVLLPGSMLPLHVFEPRYREMVEHCRNGWELMGVATLMPGYETDYDGRPPVFPTIGVGRMVAFQPMPDGRSNILLQYVARGRIIRELDAEYSFRRVEIEPAIERPATSTRVYDQVRDLVRSIGALSTAAQQEASRLVHLDGVDLLDTLARKLLERVDEQRGYLELDDGDSRGQMILGALGEVLAAAQPASGEA